MDDKNESSEKNDVDLLLREREEKDLLMKDAKESESGKLDETNELISANEISDKDDEDVTFCFPTFEEAKEQAEQIAKKVWEASWKATHFHLLPDWLQDNEYLHTGHRPQLPSFAACFGSIFRVHSETGNIWSHMLGCIIFFGIAVYVLTRPAHEVNWEDKFVFLPFFIGAIVCMGFSFAFHTLYCHSKEVGQLFLKLDYAGISFLTMGSFIPWLYYSFYCRVEPKVVYITIIVFLGLACIVISLFEKFSVPSYRPIRAGLFVLFGCSGVVPASHYFITEGIWSAFYEASFGWLLIMALLYLCGATLYACRIPERFFPGKCDIWFQSHQLFHLLVVVAAFVNYHGISELASWRGSGRSCEDRFNNLFEQSNALHVQEL